MESRASTPTWFSISPRLFWGSSDVKTAIIIIGDEIISGHKVDTNSSYLAGHLREIGIRVSRIVKVGDDLSEIVNELRGAARSYDLVLVTGGLGPTHDDLTRQALAEAFGARLVVDDATLSYIEERFRKRGLRAPDNIKSLALVPEGARTIVNPAGTAPGLVLTSGASIIYVFPGVPREAKAIFESGVIARLKLRAGRDFIRTKTLRTMGITESEISEKLADVIPALRVSLAFLPEETGVNLVLTAISDESARAADALREATNEIAPRLGDRIYSAGGEDIHVVVGKMLIQKRKTMATAESCTGGLIAHLLTEVAGISACLERGIVAYSNKAKAEVLGVDEALIKSCGAVSGEVAEAMARGVRESARTDLGLATTGIAGPTGGSETKPVGLVYLALACDGGCEVRRYIFVGEREVVKRRAAARALDMVRCHLLGGEGTP